MTPPLAIHIPRRRDNSAAAERVFIGGLGYCGLRIAEKFHDTYGCKVAGCVRSAEKQAALSEKLPVARGPRVGPGQHLHRPRRQGREALASATHIVETVAPIADFDEDPLLALHATASKEPVGRLFVVDWRLRRPRRVLD